jgi:hypothetical protein
LKSFLAADYKSYFGNKRMDISNELPKQDVLVSFLENYPKDVLHIISLCCPLSADMLRRYADIQEWGGFFNAPVSSDVNKDYWYEGVIFNQSLNIMNMKKSLRKIFCFNSSRTLPY